MFFNSPDGHWPEEVVKTYRKEDSKIQKEGRNYSANGEKNVIGEMFVTGNGDLSRYREERKKAQNMRKTEKESSKKGLIKKREVKATDDDDFKHYRCLCSPGYHGIYCQTG